tara:strand:+ start:4780 stop:5655 length:876 start_codon:yes stop_codon:yes gene_type:complete
MPAKEIPAELEEVFTTQSEKTRTNYKNMLARLRTALGVDTPIAVLDPVDIIKTIREMDVPASSKASMNTVCHVIFKFHNLDLEKFVKFRDELAEKAFDESKVKDTELLSKGITLKTLNDFMAKAFEDKEWVKFVVNYLLITFQTRNEDVDLRIISPKDFNKLTEEETKEHNWIVLHKASCMFIRNKYKTADTYGEKIVIIRNKKLLEALNLIGDGYLLKTGGSHIIPTELNRAVSNLTYEKMGSTKYFKIMATFKKNVEKMSSNRGTAPDTIYHNYKLDKKTNLKKKAESL